MARKMEMRLKVCTKCWTLIKKKKILENASNENNSMYHLVFDMIKDLSKLEFKCIKFKTN